MLGTVRVQGVTAEARYLLAAVLTQSSPREAQAELSCGWSILCTCIKRTPPMTVSQRYLAARPHDQLPDPCALTLKSPSHQGGFPVPLQLTGKVPTGVSRTRVEVRSTKAQVRGTPVWSGGLPQLSSGRRIRFHPIWIPKELPCSCTCNQSAPLAPLLMMHPGPIFRFGREKKMNADER